MITSAALTKLLRYSYAVDTWLHILDRNESYSLTDFYECSPDWEEQLQNSVSLLAEIYSRSPRIAAFQANFILGIANSNDFVKIRDAIRGSINDLDRQIHKWYSVPERKRVKCLVGNYDVDTAKVIEARIRWVAECLRVK